MAYISPDYLDDAKKYLRTGGKQLAQAKRAKCKNAATAFLTATNNAGKALLAARAAKEEIARIKATGGLVLPKEASKAKRAHSAAVKLQRRIQIFHMEFTDRCLR
jgi:hypothetical protein